MPRKHWIAVTMMTGVALVIVFMLVFNVGGLFGISIDADIPARKAADLLRVYYAQKYPAFGDLVKLGERQTRTWEAIQRSETLLRSSPIEESLNSAPHGALYTFIERNEASDTTVSVTRLDIYIASGDSCRIRIAVTHQPKTEMDGAYSSLRPIAIKDIDRLLRLAEDKRGSAVLKASPITAAESRPGL